MADRPKFGEYVSTVLRRSVASWQGVDVWFAISAYFTILLLSLWASGLVRAILGPFIETTIALLATAWIVLLVFVVTPFRLWQEERYRLNLIEEAGKPRIHAGWRFSEPYAELIITNTNTKTISGVEVSFRNHRNADGKSITDVLRSLPSTDGKQPPIDLHPLVPTYFRFAELKWSGGDPTIAIMSDTDNERWLGKEAGVKLAVFGTDAPNSQVMFRLTIRDNSKMRDHKEIGIEPWDGPQAKAVGTWREDE